MIIKFFKKTKDYLISHNFSVRSVFSVVINYWCLNTNTWEKRLLKSLLFTLLTISICGCSSQESPQQKSQVVEIAARDEGNPQEKPLIYRMKYPLHWKIETASAEESLFDTKKSLVEFFIEEGDQKIRISIHNFPSDQMHQRIPPMAQINRWKTQFQPLTSSSITPQAFAGYQGFLFEGTGWIQNVPTTMMGWALQIAPEHYRSLSRSVPSLIEKRHRQIRGDVTIKATGPTPLIEKYREEIRSSARSFQLIDDIQ